MHTGSWLTIISPLFFKLLNSKLLFRSPDRNLNTSLTNWVVVMFLEWWARLWSRDKWCKWCPRYYLFLSVNMLGADPASHLSTGVHQVGIFFPYDRTQVRYLSITRLVMFVRLDWMRKSWRFFYFGIGVFANAGADVDWCWWLICIYCIVCAPYHQTVVNWTKWLKEIGDCSVRAPDITGHERQVGCSSSKQLIFFFDFEFFCPSSISGRIFQVYLCAETHSQDFLLDCAQLCSQNVFDDCAVQTSTWWLPCLISV